MIRVDPLNVGANGLPSSHPMTPRNLMDCRRDLSLPNGVGFWLDRTAKKTKTKKKRSSRWPATLPLLPHLRQEPVEEFGRNGSRSWTTAIPIRDFSNWAGKLFFLSCVCGGVVDSALPIISLTRWAHKYKAILIKEGAVKFDTFPPQLLEGIRLRLRIRTVYKEGAPDGPSAHPLETCCTVLVYLLCGHHQSLKSKSSTSSSSSAMNFVVILLHLAAVLAVVSGDSLRKSKTPQKKKTCLLLLLLCLCLFFSFSLSLFFFFCMDALLPCPSLSFLCLLNAHTTKAAGASGNRSRKSPDSLFLGRALGGCSLFGHSCLGGHGKRSSSPAAAAPASSELSQQLPLPAGANSNININNPWLLKALRNYNNDPSSPLGAGASSDRINAYPAAWKSRLVCLYI